MGIMPLELSISNIAWSIENDERVYAYMREHGFTGLEIAPTRIFPERPYEKIGDARKFAQYMVETYGLRISSMQSIWYGRGERVFGTQEEKDVLIGYTKRAVDFAEAIGARNLVFGCPKNRKLEDGDIASVAIPFFRELGDYAAQHGTVLAMEANPVIYGTNYINKTKEAIELIQQVGSKGFKLNLDFGTVIYNGENVENLVPYVSLINHVHISEPNLKLIEHRVEHKKLISILRDYKYEGYISIEMGRRDDIQDVFNTIDYLKTL